jgi:hypothetical protein
MLLLRMVSDRDPSVSLVVEIAGMHLYVWLVIEIGSSG